MLKIKDERHNHIKRKMTKRINTKVLTKKDITFAISLVSKQATKLTGMGCLQINDSLSCSQLISSPSFRQ